MKQYLFLFTIGPVQSFIKQARKTRDLYAGSQMLSELVAEGIKTCEQAAKTQGATVKRIFPYFELDKKPESLPNRFIVKIDFQTEPSATQLRALAGNSEGGVEYAVRDCFKRMAKKALKNADKEPPKGFWPQIEQHLDIHWVFQPMDTDGYKSAYLALERLLGSVKNVRPFGQYQYQGGVPFGERGRKCSLDGENNALFFGHGSNKNYISYNGGLTVETANENEGLSAVSFVKRNWKQETFPSTAKVATLNLSFGEEEFDSKHYELLFKGSINFDEQLYFEENLNEQYFKKNGLHDLIPNLPDIRNKRQLVFGGKKLCSYYALIAFDGDSMGKWLSGTMLSGGADLEDFHQKLSLRLSVFAKNSKAIVDDTNRGKTIYAGGDDYLGFINLQYLFEVVQELREAFHKEVNGDEAEMKLTFSAGIVVAHYKEPLGMVVQKARDMEKAAKKQGDRNAFGLAVLKASGEVQQTVYKWDENEDSLDGCSNWNALQGVFDGLKEEMYSNKYVVNLTTELHQLAGIDLDEVDEQTPNAKAVTDGIKLEVKRLIGKAKNPSKPISDKQEQEMVSKVCALNDNAPTPKVQNFTHALQIADFLHRKITNN
jgi:CRISPR-associated protein Cmr2